VSPLSETNNYMTLSEVAKHLPRLNGRKVHVATIWRWCRKGLHGKHLKYTKIGRTIVVKEADLHRFFMELAESDQSYQVPRIRKRRSRRISAGRQRAIQDANEVLARAGILAAADAQQAICMSESGGKK